MRKFEFHLTPMESDILYGFKASRFGDRKTSLNQTLGALLVETLLNDKAVQDAMRLEGKLPQIGGDA